MSAVQGRAEYPELHKLFIGKNHEAGLLGIKASGLHIPGPHLGGVAGRFLLPEEWTIQGNTGVLLGLVLVSFIMLVALITVLSGIGITEHGGIGSGGVYSMISSVLGRQTGGTIGLLYMFGQVSHLRIPRGIL
ncbi:solute carrier family 12 member 8, partial [Sigmodon hispidus]